jgi:hypothetical protein
MGYKLVLPSGLEPESPAAQDFKSCVYTNSTKGAMCNFGWFLLTCLRICVKSIDCYT